MDTPSQTQNYVRYIDHPPTYAKTNDELYYDANGGTPLTRPLNPPRPRPPRGLNPLPRVSWKPLGGNPP